MEEAGSISGLVCARSYFNLLCLSLESNEVDLRNSATRAAKGTSSPGCSPLHLWVSAYLLACSLSPSPLVLPPGETDEELVPSSPRQPFTCSKAFIAS